MTRNLDALAVALMETPRRRRLPCLSAATSDVRLCFPKTLSVLAFLTLACTVSGVRAEPASTAPPLAAVTSCESLAADVPASAFSLPTNGARIDHAERIDAGGVSYCKTTGSILPVSPGAPDIRFEVDLPVSWNGKALQFGGGGYNGFIPDTTSWSSLGLRSAPPPLAQGYLTFADDSGHQAKDSNDASFAMNDESLANYAYMHIKKAKDVAFVLAVRFYGKAPRRLYFAGGSTGGREAMTAALRWPHDYDGVISNFPTATFTGLRLWGAKLAGAIYANDSAGWIAPATVDRIASAGMDDCDALDGVRDGIVSNMAACRAGAAQRLRALACPPAGTSAAADCLTDAQLKTIAVYHEGFVPSPAVVALVPSFGGYNILEGAAMNLGSDPAWHEPLLSGPNAHHAARADQFMKYIVMRDANFSLRTFDIDAPGPWAQRVAEVTAMTNAGADGWEPYVKAGGKLIFAQGADDVSVSPQQAISIYQGIREKLGDATADSFMRFYIVPGLGHGIGRFLLSWDNVGILDRWVDQGIAPPAAGIGWDANKDSGDRSRPVCPYPSWPSYKGGPVNDAASFVCAAQ